MSLPCRSLAGLAAVVAGVLVLSGCGSGSPATTAAGDHVVRSASASPTVPPDTSPAPPSPTTSARASVSPPSPSATLTAWPVTSPPSGVGRCLSGTVDILYPGGDNPLRSVCVHLGTRIHVVLHAEPGAPWRAVVSSASPVVTLGGDTVAAGSVDATAQAVGPGTAVLSASTRAGVDPGGPATRRWQLTVTVVA